MTFFVSVKASVHCSAGLTKLRSIGFAWCVYDFSCLCDVVIFLCVAKLPAASMETLADISVTEGRSCVEPQESGFHLIVVAYRF